MGIRYGVYDCVIMYHVDCVLFMNTLKSSKDPELWCEIAMYVCLLSKMFPMQSMTFIKKS